MLFEEDEIKRRWEEYITEHYNDQRGDPAPTTVEVEDGNSILLSEVEKSIKDLKTGKATGPDDVATELLKALDEDGVRRVYALVN